MKYFVFLLSLMWIWTAQAQSLQSITELKSLNKTEEQKEHGKLQFLLGRLSTLERAGYNRSGGNVSGGGDNSHLRYQGSTEDIQKIKTYQLSQLGLPAMHEQGFSGKNFRIAILDSGLSPKSAAASQVYHFEDFTGRCENKNTVCDDSGHGSKVTDLVLQAAPSAQLVILKTLSENAQGDFSHLMNALKWLVANHRKMNIKVANLSLLSPDQVYGSWNEEDQARVLVKKLSDEGVLLVAAVGNHYKNKNIDVFPASSVEVIAIGSYAHQFSNDINDRELSLFSNYGFATQPVTKHSQVLWSSHIEKNFSRWAFKPEALAPGENLLACTEYCEFISGTSFAAALAAGGLLSQLDQNPRLTRETFLTQLSASCAPPMLRNNFDHSVTCAVQFR